MKRIRIATLSMAAAFLLGGCGTILNLKSGDPDVYGGVKKDVAYIQTPPADNSATQASGQGGAILVGIIAAEVGLSLIGDTLTLPIVVRMRRNDQASDTPAKPVSEEAGKSR
jgi:uncharacterized protein YceK